MVPIIRGKRRHAWLLAGWLTLAGPALAGPPPSAEPKKDPVIELAPGTVLQFEDVPAPEPTTEPVPEFTPVQPAAVGHPHQVRKDLCTPALHPVPVGTFVYSAFQEETDLAKAERLVIYREEWTRGAPSVKDCAVYHLEQIADWLSANAKPYNLFPVRVEPSGDPVLDRTRRLTIVNYLVERGVADAETRVLLGSGRAEGLQGEIIERIYQRGQYLGTSGSQLFGTGGAASSVFPSSFGGGGFLGGNAFRGF